ncbi:phage terminase small subunit-related protein [Bacillus cereus]|uniref:phage terminase small subunit-related protein n=1 Tax=Bacillus cereus TaxID=1396 RepID=UPI002549E09C|nr:phage terminase small subunit-related protein [Bacillus cereus]MDK7411383.1 phage terminase small subunit-related protein [Bacillus cereus]MDK7416848.1 phage terminase small subunit-related protein [Bacillus cereus]
MNQAQQKAYEIWVSMGDTRTLKEAAEKSGFTHGTVRKWASKFKWNQLLEERQAPVIERMRENSDEKLDELAEAQKMLRSVSLLLVKNYLQSLVAGEIKMTSAADFERIVRGVDTLKKNGGGQPIREIMDSMWTLGKVLKESGWDNIPDLSEQPNKEDEEE